jgi:hypothetical protein
MTLNQLIKYLQQIKDLHGGSYKTNINITQLDTNLVSYNIRGKSLDIYTLRLEDSEKEFD